MNEWQELLQQAEEALHEDDSALALQLCDRAAQFAGEGRYYAGVLRGNILLALGDAAGALSSYDTVAEPSKADPQLDEARGIALFELARFAEAEKALKSALRGNDSLAASHYTLGLIAEIFDHGAAGEYFRRARKLDPENFDESSWLTQEEFEKILQEAVDGLPDSVRAMCQNLPLVVAEVPRLEELKQVDPPLSPRTTAIFFGELQPNPDLENLDNQPSVVIYKRNFERLSREPDVLKEEIQAALLHEVGHAMGLSEEDLGCC